MVTCNAPIFDRQRASRRLAEIDQQLVELAERGDQFFIDGTRLRKAADEAFLHSEELRNAAKKLLREHFRIIRSMERRA